MKSDNKLLTYLILLSSFIFFVFIAIFSEGSYGGADSYVHFRISKYAFKYPSLFLDLWGKPLFTILSSPFAQFGFVGIKIFNIIVGILTAFISIRISEHFKFANPWISGILILFSPLYFVMMPSALTELLFGLVILISILMFLKEKFILSAIIISFLPFARNEGFIILPFFFLGYIIKKNFSSIIGMFFGAIFFSLIGWSHFNDIFWIFKNNPYSGAIDIYGTGSIWHFIVKAPSIFGIPFLLLLSIGLFLILYNYFFKNRKSNNEFYFILLIVMPFLVYYAAHSYVWYSGIGGSLGLIRVIVGVVPLGALIAIYAWSKFYSAEILSLRVKRYLLILFCLLIIATPFYKKRVLINLNENDLMIKKACEWLKSESLDQNLIYYYDPMVCFYLEKDPFDKKVIKEKIDNVENPSESVDLGSVIIWDAHFGPNEGKMPLDKLIKNKDFELLKKIAPLTPFKTLNDYNYEIYIFKRK